MLHLISDKLVELVETHSDIIVKRWSKRLIEDPTTASFSRDHIEYVEDKARNVLKQMNKWVGYETTKEEVGRLYASEGIEFFRMGIPICEVHRALVVLRRIMWLFVVNESAFDSAFEMHQMRELNDRVILFFDRAEFYVLRGYTEAMDKKMKELWDLKSEDTEKVFFETSFYKK